MHRISGIHRIGVSLGMEAPLRDRTLRAGAAGREKRDQLTHHNAKKPATLSRVAWTIEYHFRRIRC